MKSASVTTIDDYILSQPEELRSLLEEMRNVIRKEVPDADEAIKYGMPTFVLNGNLVHFAAAKNHLGFYPAPSGIEAFRDELEGYVTSKGAIQFPYSRKIPFPLIRKIVRFRVRENQSKPVRKK